jgi:hypothetical protein
MRKPGEEGAGSRENTRESRLRARNWPKNEASQLHQKGSEYYVSRVLFSLFFTFPFFFLFSFLKDEYYFILLFSSESNIQK